MDSEMKRLKLKLKHTTVLYRLACKEKKQCPLKAGDVNYVITVRSKKTLLMCSFTASCVKKTITPLL